MTTSDPYADALLEELGATADAREAERKWWARHDEKAAAAALD